MRTETTTKKLFTVDEYYKMAETGVIKNARRTELINGEIFEMSAMGAWHSAAVNCADEILSELSKGKAMVRVQLPLRLNEYNEPEPDISLVTPRRDYYRVRHPGPADVLLVLEISMTSLSYDRDIKLKAYAAARIREVWIEDLQNDLLLVFRNPSKHEYKTCLTARRGDSISPVALPEVAVRVDDLLRFGA